MKKVLLMRPPASLLGTGILIFVLLTVPFCFAGTKEDIEQVQRNVLELQRQFWDLQKDLQGNSAALQDTVKKLQGTSDSMRDSQATLNSKLESILNQIQALSEKLDDTNRRLNDIGSSGVRQQAPAYAPPQNAAPSTARSSTGGDENNDSDRPPGGYDQPEPAGAVGSSSPAQPGMGSIGERQLFQAANAQYSEGKFEQALRGFQDLLDQYPSSALADDAQYMIGESYYGMKEYVDAVTEYDKVIKRFPSSPRVPGAKLKKAFSLFSLGKKGQGVVELQQIVQRYPSSKESQIARERLSQLGLD